MAVLLEKLQVEVELLGKQVAPENREQKGLDPVTEQENESFPKDKRKQTGGVGRSWLCFIPTLLVSKSCSPWTEQGAGCMACKIRRLCRATGLKKISPFLKERVNLESVVPPEEGWPEIIKLPIVFLVIAQHMPANGMWIMIMMR